jgi:hypothetical protein
MTYWNRDPKVRDVFGGLLSEIQGIRFAITPQVQCDRVAECVAVRGNADFGCVCVHFGILFKKHRNRNSKSTSNSNSAQRLGSDSSQLHHQT